MLNWIKSQIQVFSSPINFNFSQFIKLIKLNHEEHVNIIQQQKPIDQLWKKLTRTSKTPNLWSPKISFKCMKNEIKLKKKGKNSLTSTTRQKPWRKFEGKRQKITWAGSVESRETKSFLKSFEIVRNTWKAYVFKKPFERFLISQKIDLIDQKSHSIGLASIETGRFKPKILITISIG